MFGCVRRGRRRESGDLASYQFKIRKFLVHNVLHADDSPHVIALGVGIAMVVTFLPLVGIQTFVAVGIAALFRANKAVCIPIVWITNPATMWPVYYGCVRLGRLVTPAAYTHGNGAIERLRELTQTGTIFELKFWSEMSQLLLGLGVELWVGCAIVGVTLGIVSYVLARWSVSAYRERRRQRVLRRELYRSQFQKAKVRRRGEPA